jgi:lysophospholipase L1-like esterase
MSITAGLNVSGFAGDDKNFKPTAPYMHSYVDLFGEELARKYNTTVNIINGSCGGKTVAWIDKYCKEMVNPNNPDLVILDMGMNDIWGTTTAAAFRASMKSCIDKIKLGCPNAEFILIGNMLPDVNSPGSPANGNTIMYGFLQELKSLEGPGIAVFDMTSLSDTIYKRKGATHCHSNSLHPNDYLARWYAQGLVNLLNTSTSMSTTYYVNTTGNNTDGLSLATAWTNLTKVNSFSFKPGDTLLFEGGKTFAGNLNFDAFDAGNSTTRLVLKSYGTGVRAKIKTNSSAVCGFKATNTQGITIENLIFEGPGTTLSKDMDGIQFYTDLPTGKLSGIELKTTMGCECKEWV